MGTRAARSLGTPSLTAINSWWGGGKDGLPSPPPYTQASLALSHASLPALCKARGEPGSETGRSWAGCVLRALLQGLPAPPPPGGTHPGQQSGSLLKELGAKLPLRRHSQRLKAAALPNRKIPKRRREAGGGVTVRGGEKQQPPSAWPARRVEIPSYLGIPYVAASITRPAPSRSSINRG